MLLSLSVSLSLPHFLSIPVNTTPSPSPARKHRHGLQLQLPCNQREQAQCSVKSEKHLFSHFPPSCPGCLLLTHFYDVFFVVHEALPRQITSSSICKNSYSFEFSGGDSGSVVFVGVRQGTGYSWALRLKKTHKKQTKTQTNKTNKKTQKKHTAYLFPYAVSFTVMKDSLHQRQLSELSTLNNFNHCFRLLICGASILSQKWCDARLVSKR